MKVAFDRWDTEAVKTDGTCPHSHGPLLTAQVSYRQASPLHTPPWVPMAGGGGLFIFNKNLPAPTSVLSAAEMGDVWDRGLVYSLASALQAVWLGQTGEAGAPQGPTPTHY